MATSDSRERAARDVLDAFKAGDQDRLLLLLSDDVVVFSHPELPNSGTFHGREGYVQWTEPWMDAWESFDVDFLDSIPVGERHMVLRVTQRAKGREGIELAMDAAYAFEVDRDGTVTYMALFPDSERATAAAREREDA